MPPPKPTTIVGPNATVLRLGSGAQQKIVGSGPKPPVEKPTLVAKPAAPAPVRSPWAQLPPIDKVPPVSINPLTLSSTSQPQQKETQESENSPAPPSTTVEIAADSFTRTRRDTQNGGQGQLYNSQSGRYEPVSATRRSSMRKDQNFRPPALLQRPPTNEVVETHNGFQNHKAGLQQDHGIPNQRSSSAFSGEGGSNGRRASITQGSDVSKMPTELQQQRRDSQPLQSPVQSYVPTRRAQNNTSGAAQQSQIDPQPSTSSDHRLNEPASATPSPQQSKALSSDANITSHASNNVATQSRIMREKIELARERKKIEAEREEAAKKERIRLKMEALGSLPQPKPMDPEDVAIEKKNNDSKEIEVKKAEPKLDVVKEIKDAPEPPRTSQELIEPAAHSPPKPPLMDAPGTPKQYGLMKVHGPPLTNGIQPSSERLVSGSQKSAATTQQKVSSSPQMPMAIMPDQVSSPKVNGELGPKHTDPLITRSPDLRSQEAFSGQRTQNWKSMQNDSDAYSGWNGAGTPTHASPSGNLWGPPSNVKSLGNGVFDRNVQRPPSRQTPYQEHYLPPPPQQPIGTPKNSQRSQDSPESLRGQQTRSPVPTREDIQIIPNFPPADSSARASSKSVSADSQTTQKEKSVSPLQLGHAGQVIPQIDGERSSGDQSRAALAAWTNFHITSAREETEKRHQAAEEHAVRLAEEARLGVRNEPQLPLMNETWRQVVIGDQAGQRHVVGVSKNLPGQASNQQTHEDKPSTLYSDVPTFTAAAGGSRGSRFFPGIGQGTQSQPPRAVSYTFGFSRSASPPPPDSASHPAYSRDQRLPIVKLPFSKPRPTVRLPPSSTTSVPSPVMTHVQALPSRTVSQPLTNNSSWQDRFNGLLGVRKPSHEKRNAAITEFSATKVPLEMPAARVSVAVSLPPNESEVAESMTGEVVSKAIEDEEALFENREFGSSPTVHVPAKGLYEAQAGLKPLNNHRHQNSRLGRPKEVDAESAKSFIDKDYEAPNGIVIVVALLGMKEKITKTMQKSKSHNSGHNSQRNRHSSGNARQGRGFKSRESSGNFTAQKSTPNNVSRNSLPSGAGPQVKSQFNKQNPNWSANSRVISAV